MPILVRGPLVSLLTLNAKLVFVQTFHSPNGYAVCVQASIKESLGLQQTFQRVQQGFAESSGLLLGTHVWQGNELLAVDHLQVALANDAMQAT